MKITRVVNGVYVVANRDVQTFTVEIAQNFIDFVNSNFNSDAAELKWLELTFQDDGTTDGEFLFKNKRVIEKFKGVII